jgi:hypothetical protein
MARAFGSVTNNIKMKASEILKRYISAIETETWDYPKGSQFNTNDEVYRLVSQGYTVYEFAAWAIIQFASVTSAMMAFAGLRNASQSTRKALTKAIKYAINKTA